MLLILILFIVNNVLGNCDNHELPKYCLDDILIVNGTCSCDSSSTKILNYDLSYVCTKNTATCNSTNLKYCCDSTSYYSIIKHKCVYLPALNYNDFNCSDSEIIDTYFDSYNGSVCVTQGNYYFTYSSSCLANNSGYKVLYYGDCCDSGYVRDFNISISNCQCQTWIDNHFNQTFFEQNLCKPNQAPYNNCSYYTCNNLCHKESEVSPQIGYRGYQCNCSQSINCCQNKKCDCKPTCYSDGYDYVNISTKTCDCNFTKLYDGYCPNTDCISPVTTFSPAPAIILCLGYESHLCNYTVISITSTCNGIEQWVYLSSNGTFIYYNTKQYNFYPCNVDIYTTYSVVGFDFGKKCDKCNRYVDVLPPNIYCRNAILDNTCITSLYSMCGSCEYPYNPNDPRLCCSLPDNKFQFIPADVNTKDPNGVCCPDTLVDNFGYCCLIPNFLNEGYCCNSYTNYTVCALNSTDNQIEEAYCVMLGKNDTFVNDDTCNPCNASFTLVEDICCDLDIFPDVIDGECCNELKCCPSNNLISYNNSCCPYDTYWDNGAEYCCSYAGQNIGDSILCCANGTYNVQPGDTNICCEFHDILVNGCCYPDWINSNGICCPNNPQESYTDPGLGTCCSAATTYGTEICCYQGMEYNTTTGDCCDISNPTSCCVPGTESCNQTNSFICPSGNYNNGVDSCCTVIDTVTQCCPYGEYYNSTTGCSLGIFSYPNGTSYVYYCPPPSYPIYNITINGPSCVVNIDGLVCPYGDVASFDESSNRVCCDPSQVSDNNTCCTSVGMVNVSGFCCESDQIVEDICCTTLGKVSKGAACCFANQSYIITQSVCCDNIRVAGFGEICCLDTQITVNNLCCLETEVDDYGDCCSYTGKYNSYGLCCSSGQYNSSGLCCPNGQYNSSGLCCLNGTINSDGLCCPDGQYNSDGLCCSTGHYNSGGICCLNNQTNTQGTCCNNNQVIHSNQCCPGDTITSTNGNICCEPYNIATIGPFTGDCCPVIAESGTYLVTVVSEIDPTQIICCLPGSGDVVNCGDNNCCDLGSTSCFGNVCISPM